MKLKWKHKLHSGALQFTVFISVVVALILAGVVLLAYTHRFFIEQSKAIVDNIQLANSGTEALKLQEFVSIDTTVLALPDVREQQAVKINLSHWGLFEKAYVKTTHRQKEFIKCSLLGTAITTLNRPALYLQDTYKPLAVVGTTRIEGNAYLSNQGVRPGNISGHSYYGTQLIYGNVKKSSTALPKLRYDYKQLLNYYLKDYMPATSGNFIFLQQNARVINSFKEPVKGYFSEAPIVLQNISVTGNIIIRSAQKITIRKTALLKDIIVAAPVIVIEDGVAGNFQAIAITTIKVGKNCILNYPSALVIQNSDSQPVNPNDPLNNKIYIGDNTKIRGSVCFLGIINESSFSVNIYISQKAIIKGEIYCEGNLELRGSVSGTVYAYQFLTNEAGTIYVNHIYDAAIISTALPESFGGILMENQTKSVMKWLY